jgi:hypothetical protein
MERQYCKECGKWSAFSRDWTIGMFFGYWIFGFLTSGFGLLFLPLLFPKHCRNCGAKK